MLAQRLIPLAFAGSCLAVTIYTDIPGVNGPLTTSTAPFAQTTGNSAYSSLVLNPPAPPTDLQKAWTVAVQPAAGQRLSVPQKGSFLGFSVELSVATAVLGLNSTFIHPPFLNYMANIKERIGHGPTVRVGGNSQDESFMYQDMFTDSFGRPQMIRKWRVDNNNPTETPNIDFSVDLLYTMANISALVDVDWYFGLAFNAPYNDSNAVLVAETTERILGKHLISLQLGNEPDLYGGHGRRNPEYSIQDYFLEFQHVVTDLQASQLQNKKSLLGPSVCCAWSTDQVINAGFLQQFGSVVNVVGVMHYPANNCQIGGRIIDPQSIFANYLTHRSAQVFVENYQAIAPVITGQGYPLVVLETNTASCGGFPGISDSFASALWAMDSAFALAADNFTQVLLHVGGQSDSYNPFTPPPTNISKTHMWTTGPVYYATIGVAEAFGSSNNSRIVDMNLPSLLRPGYAIYEDDIPSRLALFNYVTDVSGANDYDAQITFNGGLTMPDHVSVRYLRAPSTAEKFDITWANQTLGTMFKSDGRFLGTHETVTIQCDTALGFCSVPMKAPSFAVVFLTDDALARSSPASPTETLTFATTAFTNKQHVFIDPAVLKTMQGDGGPGPRHTGSTGRDGLINNGKANSGLTAIVLPALWSLFAVSLGGILLTAWCR